MIEARDIIAEAFGLICFDVLHPTGTNGGTIRAGDAILAALTAAGWTLAPPGSRVVPEGGVDAETVERCAQVADEKAEIYEDPAEIALWPACCKPIAVRLRGLADDIRSLAMRGGL